MVLSLFFFLSPRIYAAGGKGVISEVRYLCSIPLPEKDLERLTEIEPGDSYSPRELDRAVKLLYLTRKFHQVEAEVFSRDERLEIEFYLVPRRIIGEISIRGQRSVKQGEIRRVLGMEGIRPGADYSERMKSQLRKVIQDLFKEHGFSNPGIEVKEIFSRENFGVSLEVKITPGDFIGVKTIELVGDTYFPRERVRERLGIEAGDRLDWKRLRERVKKLERWYRNQKLWEATIERPEARLEDEGRTARVILTIQAGQKVGLDFSGPDLPEKEIRDLRRMAQLGKDEEYSLAWAGEKAREIEEFYRKRGRIFARVETEKYDLSQREMVIKFQVDKGPAIYLRKIEFAGNESLGSGLLRKQMLSNRRDLFGHLFQKHNGIFLEKLLEEDLDAIVYLYRKRGFPDARVVKVDRDIRRPDRQDNGAGDLILKIEIEEGIRVRVEEVGFSGNRILSAGEAGKLAGIKAGDLLDPSRLEEGRKELIEWYARNGFSSAQVNVQTEIAPDRGSARVVYSIEEGLQVRLGKIIVSGTRWTRDRVIQREFHLREGDVYDYEKIIEGRRRLYGLGFLRESQADSPLRDASQDEWDLLVRVREEKGGAFEVGGGYATEDGLRAFAGLRHWNLAGTGRGAHARAECKLGKIDWLQDLVDRDRYDLTEWRFDLGYREPWLFGRNFIGKVDFISHFESENWGYDFYRNMGVFGVEREFSSYVKGLFKYRIEHLHREYPDNYLMGVKYGILWVGPPEEFIDTVIGYMKNPEREWLGIISPILVVDQRDDIFNPTRGMKITSSVDFSHPYLASDRSYVKFWEEGGIYQPLGGRLVGALVLRAGYGFGLGEKQDIPTEERFFLGGVNSVRGFLQNEIGPSQKGGKILINCQLELRFPLPVVKRLGGVVFTDGGGLWEDREDFDWDGFRQTAGLGLRYYTPIGPILLDWGYKLDRKEGEDAYEYHLAIGNPF